MRRRSSTDTTIGAALLAFKDICPRAYQKVNNTMGGQNEAPGHLPELGLGPVLVFEPSHGGLG